jgi:ABC-type nitrate/sulfonate/bicarbonate transport system permease component
LSRLTAWLPPLAVAAVACLVWEAAVRLSDTPAWLLPAPGAVLAETWRSAGLLAEHASTTLLEVVLGFGLAAVCGAGLATAVAWSRVLERSVYPFVIASQVVPVIAIAPLLLVWVGPGLTSKVIIVALISFFPVTVNVADGLRSADPEMADMFRTLGATKRQVFLKLRAPSAVPYFVSGLKVASVTAVIGAVIGEWVGAQGGLGWLMRVSAPQLQTSRVFASILVLSVIAAVLFVAVTAGGRWLLRRYPQEGALQA